MGFGCGCGLVFVVGNNLNYLTIVSDNLAKSMDVEWSLRSEETPSYDSLNHYKVSGMWWPANKGG